MKYISRLFYCATAAVLLLASCQTRSEEVRDAEQTYTVPHLYPDYVGVTIPMGIAPLDFTVDVANVSLVDVVISGSNNGELHSQAPGEEGTSMDVEAWHQLLNANRGGDLYVTVSAKIEGKWYSYQPFPIHVSEDDIDYGITYRLIEPGYEAYTKMGIYETRLSDGEERALIENTQFRGCVNCHSFRQCDPNSMQLHIRGDHGATLIGKTEGDHLALTAYNTKTAQTLGTCVYPYWHPSDDYIAYSTNTTRQGFHVGGEKIVEVVDLASDVQVYDIRRNTLLQSPLLRNDSLYENYPVFSPDGKTLYFCSANTHGDKDPQHIRYSLLKIAFDPQTGTFGNHLDTMICADDIQQSICFPRPSYDGRFLCYTRADYGCFPAWHKESELWMLDLQSGESRCMEPANSRDAESYHSWSSNSRWLVFGSRRDDGLYTHAYLCHVDTAGEIGKAFMLPHAAPRRFYMQRFFSYNVPEFVTAPVPLDNKQTEKLILSTQRKQMLSD